MSKYINKMQKNKKYLIVIDSIFLLGGLISIAMLVGYSQPLVTAPLDEVEKPLFIIPDTDYLQIDNNLKFSSPKTVFIDEKFSILPGKHFIKFSYGLKNEIREMDAKIELKLQLRRINENSIGLFNVGQSDLEIETYNVGSLVKSSTILGEENE